MKRGFTLIELLVCIGVVGVLIGISLPVLAGARGTGLRLACAANLRSIGQAMTMYLDAGDGMLPGATRAAVAGTVYLAPWNTLTDFLDAPFPVVDAVHGGAITGDPWACPADKEQAPVTGFSYAYAPSVSMGVGMTRRWTTTKFMSDGLGVIALDALPLHGRSEPQARNAVHSDGSVGPHRGPIFTYRYP
jgi:prepilin-type N-terminal cleavage/methylation domain-containing protein